MYSRRWFQDWLGWFIILTLVVGVATAVNFYRSIGQPFGGYLTFYNPISNRWNIDIITPTWWPGISEASLAVEKFWVEQVVANLSQLASREMEVSQYIATGYTIQGIADILYISPKTAENYAGRIYSRLGLSQMQTDALHLRKVTILFRAFLVYDLTVANEVVKCVA